MVYKVSQIIILAKLAKKLASVKNIAIRVTCNYAMYVDDKCGVRISSTFSVLRPLYFDSLTSTSVLRPFVKSGVLIGSYRSKYSFGRSKEVEVRFRSK